MPTPSTPFFARVSARFFPDPGRGGGRTCTPTGAARKPAGDRLALALYRRGFRGFAVLREHAGDAIAVAHGWAAWAVDPLVPEPTIAPLLAASVGGSAPVPQPLATLSARTRGLVDDVAARFAPRGSDPEEAPVAAGLFIGAVAPTRAGMVGGVAVAGPPPRGHP